MEGPGLGWDACCIQEKLQVVWTWGWRKKEPIDNMKQQFWWVGEVHIKSYKHRHGGLGLGCMVHVAHKKNCKLYGHGGGEERSRLII